VALEEEGGGLNRSYKHFERFSHRYITTDSNNVTSKVEKNAHKDLY